MEGRISPIRVKFLQILMESDATILSKVQTRDKVRKGEKPKKISITEDGQIFFYYSKFPLWWQRLFNDYESVTIIDASIRIADAITGTHSTRNEEAFDGITKAILDKAIKENDLDCVVDILFDQMRGSTDGVLGSKYINEKYLKEYASRKDPNRKVSVKSTGHNAYIGLRTDDGRCLPCFFGKELVISED